MASDLGVRDSVRRSSQLGRACPFWPLDKAGIPTLRSMWGHRRRGVGLCAGLVLAGAVLIGCTGGSSTPATSAPGSIPATSTGSTPTPATTTVTVPVAAEPARTCALAFTLVDAGRPQQALRQLDDPSKPQVIDDPVCRDLATRARTAVAASATSAKIVAVDAKAAKSRADWQAVEEAAQGVLAQDGDNESAKASLKMATMALVEESPAQGLQTWWADWYARTLEPIQDPLTAAVVLFAALVVLARLLVNAIRRPLRLTAGQSEACTRSGIALLAVASLAAPLVLNWNPSQVLLWLVLFAVLALGAIGMTTLGLATRLRVNVDVTAEGKADSVAAGHVAALVGELGASKPRGIEFPLGADVSGLESSVVKALPDNAVVKVLKGVVEAIAGTTPWKVSVDVTSTDVISVRMYRNGRLAESGVVERGLLGLSLTSSTDGSPKAHGGTALVTTTEGSPATGGVATGEATAAKVIAPDLHRMVAALVLTTLCASHKGLDGLAGATSWKSVGWQFIASSDLIQHKAHQRELLARAVDEDPTNLLAQYALSYVAHRDATTYAELWSFHTALAKYLPTPHQPGTAALRLRMQMTQLAILTNAYYATDDRLKRELARQEAGHVAASLVTDLNADHSPLADQMKPQARELVRWFNDTVSVALAPTPAALPEADFKEWPTAGGPTAWYQEACRWATTGKDDAKAAKLLTDAAINPEIQAWAMKDPQLRMYHQRHPGTPESDIFTLPTLEPYRTALKTAGWTTLDDLVPVANSRLRLAVLLSLKGPELQRVLRTIELLEKAPLGAWRVELVRALLECDAVRPEGSPLLRPGVDAAAIVKSLAERHLYPRGGDLANLQTWLVAND